MTRARGHDDAVIVFLKAPVAGEVKTRLSPGIAPAAAALLYRAMVEDLLARLERLASADVLLHHAPESSRGAIARWLGPDRRLARQRGADLGARMSHAFRSAFHDGYGRVVIVGSDVPELTGRIVRAGLAALRRHDVALAPAHDGGYYLIGLREPRPGLFHEMRWSTRGVHAETVRRLTRLGLTHAELPPLEDIDTYASLRRLRDRLDKGAIRPASMPRVAAIVRAMRLPR
ncbi:MAG: TIGR04282 family arsenosugar biosynthesis glycosyltransferase [Candidatus Eisenbacteria bacterium]